jgi:hypothetical protein
VHLNTAPALEGGGCQAEEGLASLGPIVSVPVGSGNIFCLKKGILEQFDMASTVKAISLQHNKLEPQALPITTGQHKSVPMGMQTFLPENPGGQADHPEIDPSPHIKINSQGVGK